MAFFINGEDIEKLDGYIFCDSDFLGLLFRDEILLAEILSKLKQQSLVIDSYSRLEFMRDVFLPEQIQIRDRFLVNFIDAEDHTEIYKHSKVNSLVLSKIYAHNKKNGVSIVDLLLAGRIMQSKYRSYLITGNAKDYPSCVFDRVSVINYEEKDGNVKAISILRFNKEKFDFAYSVMRKARGQLKS